MVGISFCRTLSPAAGAAGKLLVGNCWADAGQQRRLVRSFMTECHAKSMKATCKKTLLVAGLKVRSFGSSRISRSSVFRRLISGHRPGAARFTSICENRYLPGKVVCKCGFLDPSPACTVLVPTDLGKYPTGLPK